MTIQKKETPYGISFFIRNHRSSCSIILLSSLKTKNLMNHHHQHPEEHKKHQHHSHEEQGKKEKVLKETTREGHGEHHGHMIGDFKKRFWISVILTLPILLLSPMIQMFIGIEGAISFPGDIYVLLLLSTIVYVYGGYPFLKGFFDEITRLKPGMMTLIAMAISVAYFYSAAVSLGVDGEMLFWELATLIDIMLLGHWIEMRSVMGASSALEELVKLLPDTAHKITAEDEVIDIPVNELQHNDKLLIKPGEKVPADGIIIEGTTSVNESMITGESKPVLKEKGMEVIGGSINGEGSIKIEVQKTGEETFLSQVVKLVQEAQESKSRTQNLANRAAFWLTITALTAGAATLIIWTAVLDASFNFALTRTVTVMVIACPHALGLAIPLVVSVSTALSAKSGLLIKNRTAFEQARNIQAVVFDKTGTLTKGEFGVTGITSYTDEFDEKEVLEYTAAVESESEHPIAQAIFKSSEGKYKVQDLNSIPGKGAEGKVNGKEIKVVSPGYLRENQIEVPGDTKDATGKTIVYLLAGGKLTASITLADEVRPESREAVNQLKKMGIKTMILTGDNKKVAEWVAGELGLDDYFAEVLPGDKANKIKEVQQRGLIVCMTGDGVNDAPALAQADVGIAIGSGTDVAIETADIILVRSNPLDVVSAIKFAKATYRKMVQNLAWATGYNIFAIPLAAGVLFYEGILLSPALGAVLMSASTVIVAINARLLKAG
jgi:P-type Cu2+ transporter